MNVPIRVNEITSSGDIEGVSIRAGGEILGSYSEGQTPPGILSPIGLVSLPSFSVVDDKCHVLGF